jgi:hypothetical protein
MMGIREASQSTLKGERTPLEGASDDQLAPPGVQSGALFLPHARLIA